ncbi:hypothetical protein LIT38_15730 [Bacillus sp. CMF12]|uniref:hypothetical protein n=1 Tax=Bacillus sp. CMF12 TaxID=2884834 RepID=UPI002079938D|nr:hypothetical protein [Bacillus sp. CMF12]USK48022.1 hypothetical protein LIT38_15730 [Bacillus sp. CMF12]
MINVKFAQLIRNHVKDHKSYYIEIFYVDNGIQAFASFQENIAKNEDSLVGSGSHADNKDLAIENAIADLMYQLN